MKRVLVVTALENRVLGSVLARNVVCVRRVMENDEEVSAKSGFVRVVGVLRNGLAATGGLKELPGRDLAERVLVVRAKMRRLVVRRAKLLPEAENHAVMVAAKEALPH